MHLCAELGLEAGGGSSLMESLEGKFLSTIKNVTVSIFRHLAGVDLNGV
jgi:hypothetical protein